MATCRCWFNRGGTVEGIVLRICHQALVYAGRHRVDNLGPARTG
jgi:hypothetical protein